MNFIFPLFFIVFCYSQNSIPNQIEKSIFFFNENDHKVSLGISFQNSNNTIDKYFSGNLWFSDNLAINSSLSSSSNNSDINLYYNSSITYLPSSTIFKNFSTNINIGMHRVRLYKYRSFKWYDFSLLSSFKFNSHKILLAWNYLTHIKNKHLIHFSYKRMINDNVNLIIGSKIYRNNSIKIQPHFRLMINL